MHISMYVLFASFYALAGEVCRNTCSTYALIFKEPKQVRHSYLK